MAKKKAKAGSVESQVKALIDASTPIDPLPHSKLRDGDRPFWDGIVRARARDEWIDCDLVVAAQLARCQADIEAEQVALDGEGSVLVNERGTQIVNPRVSVLEQLARREMALMRSLRMGGRVSGDSRDDAGARKLQKEAAKLRKEIAEEDLLAS